MKRISHAHARNGSSITVQSFCHLTSMFSTAKHLVIKLPFHWAFLSSNIALVVDLALGPKGQAASREALLGTEGCELEAGVGPDVLEKVS
eukprot:763878-Hanusia_phi.AAC.1